MSITALFVFMMVIVIGNARNTRHYCPDVSNVAVPLSALVELTEGDAEFAVCSHYFTALSVQRPGHRKISLIDTCAPILVKNPMNAIFALINVLKKVI